MIRKIKIHGYKCIKDMEIDCGALTLLAGDNMSGKTAVIEALLSGEGREESGFPSLPAGFDDIHTDGLDDGVITVETVNDDGRTHYTMFCRNGTVAAESNVNTVFGYIPAAKTLMRPKSNVFISSGISVAGMSGIRIESAQKVLDDEMVVSYPDTMAGQICMWVKKITGVAMESRGRDQEYFFVREKGGRSIAGTVTGAGIKNTVNIVWSCLSSPKGAVICVEDPETGLSPRAQHEMAEFLYFIASAGRQVIVETHSDHIFNAIRAWISIGEIDHEKVFFNYLVLNEDLRETECNPVKVGRYGHLKGMNSKMTLDGFFDQFSKDLDVMLGLCDP